MYQKLALAIAFSPRMEALIAEARKLIQIFEGELIFDNTKPDGTPRKLLDVSKLKKECWTFQTKLIKGIESTYK